jgi:hypothetical protein
MDKTVFPSLVSPLISVTVASMLKSKMGSVALSTETSGIAAKVIFKFSLASVVNLACCDLL